MGDFFFIYGRLSSLINSALYETFLRFRRYEDSPTPETYCRVAVTKNTTFQSRKSIFTSTAAAKLAAIRAHILWICGRSQKNRVYTTLSDGWCHQTIIKNLAWVSFWANCEKQDGCHECLQNGCHGFFHFFLHFSINTCSFSNTAQIFFPITCPSEFWCPSIFWGFGELWSTFKWTTAVLPNIIKCLITVKLVHLQYFAQICS